MHTARERIKIDSELITREVCVSVSECVCVCVCVYAHRQGEDQD
jgi:hypothetical protein